MSELPRITITDEMVGPSQPDLLQQVQRRLADGVYRQERARLAAVAGDEVAWIGFPPIPGDDPAEYAPYWQRLSDVVTNESMFLDELANFTVLIAATDPPSSGVDRYLALCADEDARNPLQHNRQEQRIMEHMEKR